MSHPGTYINAPTLGVTGLVPGDTNTAVSFDPSGGAQYVVQDDTIAAQTFTAFTIGCIVKPASPVTSGNWPLFGADANDSGDEIVLLLNETPEFLFIGSNPVGGSFVLSYSPVNAGTTYRVIGTWDGTTAKLYVNGSVVDSAAFSEPISFTVPETFYAATDGGDQSSGINGVLDECFFVANHAATTDEIATIDAAMTGTGSVLTAVNGLLPYIYWRLGESSGTVAEDSAGGVGNLFTPPIAYDMGPILPDTRGLQRLLFRHYSPHGRFQTVWKLATDPITYSLIQPYPLITPEDVQQGNMPIGQTYNAATYLHVYYGPELVDDAEAARLIASGIGTVT